MAQITPFLWFNDTAEAAADFYLQVFPNAVKRSEFLSQGQGPQPAGKVLVVDLEIEGQKMTFLNGGPSQQLTPAFSFSVHCETQAEIDHYWDRLLDGGQPMACGWLTDRFGLCWQIVPRQLGEWIKQPRAMQAMMDMVKLDMAALQAAAQGSEPHTILTPPAQPC